MPTSKLTKNGGQKNENVSIHAIYRNHMIKITLGECAIDMESRDSASARPSPDPKLGKTLAKKAGEWFQSQLVPTGPAGSTDSGGATRIDLEMKGFNQQSINQHIPTSSLNHY